ncbi:MAG: hypothetical protein KA792_08210 [Bacteroidales bacterium]|nr:hypothetical protein [Bacteroidales bacterium]
MDEKIVYILIGIAYLVYSFLKKDKKSKTAKALPKQNESPPKENFKTIFEKALLGDEFFEKPIVVDTAPKETIKKESKDVKKNTFLSGEDSDLIENYMKDQTIDYSNNTVHSSANQNSYRKNFNLKQAVVFSEILKRPYN